MPPSLPLQRINNEHSLMSVSAKQSMKFAGKGKPEHNLYLFIYFFGLGFLIITLNHQNPGLLDRQENEA